MTENTIILLTVPVALVFGVLLGVANYRLRLGKARRLLADWAAQQNLNVVSAQPRHIRCGPFRFRASKAQQVFHVIAETDSGAIKEGFALCGGAFTGLMSHSVKVHWNN